MKVHVDKHGYPSSTFHFTCHGRVGIKRRFSVSTALLELERGNVIRPLSVTDVCQGGLVSVAFKRSLFNFAVDMGENKMLKWPLGRSLIGGVRAFTYEILSTFLDEHQLTPTFLDDNNVHVWYDVEAGEWSGLLAMVRKDFIILVFRVYF